MVGPYSLSYRGGEMRELLTTVDGRPLKEALANAERSKRIRAVISDRIDVVPLGGKSIDCGTYG
jgi:hypothetical protein